MTGTVVISEFPIKSRESFRAEITDRSGKLAVSLSRYKKGSDGQARRAGPAFEFWAHRARAVIKILQDVSQVLQAQQPFFDGSEADHGGVNADQALALDTAALLKGSA
jgi:hypothetical protein